jgi:hypothetical protein
MSHTKWRKRSNNRGRDEAPSPENRRRPHGLERHPVAESAVEQDLTALEYDYAVVAKKMQLLLMVLNFSKVVGKHVSHHYRAPPH